MSTPDVSTPSSGAAPGTVAATVSTPPPTDQNGDVDSTPGWIMPVAIVGVVAAAAAAVAGLVLARRR